VVHFALIVLQFGVFKGSIPHPYPEPESVSISFARSFPKNLKAE
jgi:hypothetical protein